LIFINVQHYNNLFKKLN